MAGVVGFTGTSRELPEPGGLIVERADAQDGTQPMYCLVSHGWPIRELEPDRMDACNTATAGFPPVANASAYAGMRSALSTCRPSLSSRALIPGLAK
eukprot:CAMPEP_0181226108 /NCGR_PEP_ID=MMETSP1096-20121128/32076_1 /TAXON_ID=156174 ORGANISM="Chrysochromulina ericina, Strain CCMP281" /NCGR_SAMPLE_ID=MMETSP1096 /ASSEMBLY_ACC=CAM_ASM_000453 /LENGTH=96 /DNA_ID=CAMNT_0023319419 /DNA_START=534 /DNA_END=825 /DNA_ORIENTATION=-